MHHAPTTLPTKRPSLSDRVRTRVREAGPRQWAVWATTAAAGALGLAYGYAFGDRLGGPWLGVVLAVNGAAICSLVADATLEPFAARRRRG